MTDTPGASRLSARGGSCTIRGPAVMAAFPKAQAEQPPESPTEVRDSQQMTAKVPLQFAPLERYSHDLAPGQHDVLEDRAQRSAQPIRHRSLEAPFGCGLESEVAAE